MSMAAFKDARDACEGEGVFIGGWSLKYMIFPEKLNGKHSECAEFGTPFLSSHYLD